MRKTFLVSCLLGVSLLPASPQGAQAKEQRVTMDSLPAAVRKTATEQSKGATMRGISTETEHGKTLYEVELTVNGHTRDVLIAADGSVSEVEEEIAVASLPAPVKVTLEQDTAPTPPERSAANAPTVTPNLTPPHASHTLKRTALPSRSTMLQQNVLSNQLSNQR
jgi:hypothetical protein